jgi:hypothetical protein
MSKKRSLVFVPLFAVWQAAHVPPPTLDAVEQRLTACDLGAALMLFAGPPVQEVESASTFRHRR